MRPRFSRKAVLFYRILLVAYPPDFRREHGEESARTFAELDRDAAGRLVRARLWIRTIRDVISGGLRERIDVRAERARSALAGDVAASSSQTGSRFAGLATDARRALRLFVRQPAFALTVVFLVALGIGTTTTIFSVVDAVLIRPLPYPAAGRLVDVTRDRSSFPIPDFVDLRGRARSFDAMGAVWTQSLPLTGAGTPEELHAALVAGDLFQMLGATVERGRLFGADDFAPGAARVAILSDGLWRRRFGGDPAIVGRTITLGGEPASVVGILAASFVRPEALELAETDAFLPLDVTAGNAATDRHSYVLDVLARLAPGVTLDAARAEMAVLADRFAREFPDAWRTRRGTADPIVLASLLDDTVGGARRQLWPFLGAVLLMLLIACANIANLCLARTQEQRHEIALRAVLGAGRARLVRHLLTESVVLALFGGALGFVLASAGLRAFTALAPAGMPRLSELQLNGTVLAFAAGLSAVTGLVFGLVPALRATGGDAATAREESRTATAAGLRLRSTLVVAELAIALVLVVGSSLLFNSFLRLSAIDPGFDPHHVVSIQLDTSTIAAGDRAAFEDALINGLRALPGVQAAGASWQLPFSPNGHCCWATQIAADGVPDKTLIAYVHPVTPGYFRALGIPIVDGRLFAPGDMSADQLPKPGPQAPAHVPARMPIIVSRSAADAWWPAGRAVGRVIRLRHNTTAFEVVGVAQSVRQWGLDSEPGIDAYVPLSAVASWNLGRLDIAIRHTGDGANLTSAARDVLAKLEPTLALAGSATMDARVSGSIASPRFDAVLLTTFGVLALLLASAGVYASMRYLVGVRRREMSIRLALGASPRDLVRHVVGHGLVLVCVGSAIGVAASLALSRVLKNLLFQISPTDPLAVTAAVLLMAGAALAACWGPARRAAAADPAATLH